MGYVATGAITRSRTFGTGAQETELTGRVVKKSPRIVSPTRVTRPIYGGGALVLEKPPPLPTGTRTLFPSPEVSRDKGGITVLEAAPIRPTKEPLVTKEPRIISQPPRFTTAPSPPPPPPVAPPPQPVIDPSGAGASQWWTDESWAGAKSPQEIVDELLDEAEIEPAAPPKKKTGVGTIALIGAAALAAAYAIWGS
ncbi:MAG: hypothetical protein ACYSWU_00085 [Planctomycetota bacterium]|jgi:hypothetical protein